MATIIRTSNADILDKLQNDFRDGGLHAYTVNFGPDGLSTSADYGDPQDRHDHLVAELAKANRRAAKWKRRARKWKARANGQAVANG